MGHGARSPSTVLSAEDISRQPEYQFSDDRRGKGLTWRTLTSASETGSHDITSGIARCTPSTGQLCPHQHRQAELYHIMQGHGIVTIDGVETAVKAGSVAFIPGDAKHGIRNTSDSEDLVWFYVFAVNDFDEIQYRFPHDQEEKPVRARL